MIRFIYYTIGVDIGAISYTCCILLGVHFTKPHAVQVMFLHKANLSRPLVAGSRGDGDGVSREKNKYPP